jgi:hypothetical protein
MRIIDSHWWPRSMFEHVCARTRPPRAERNGRSGYDYHHRVDNGAHFSTH